MRSYAIPLFSIVDPKKVDLKSPQLPELAEKLQLHLAQAYQIDAIDGRIELAGDEPMLVLHGVTTAGLPHLFALADVQRAQVYDYKRESEDQFTLRQLAVRPTDEDSN